MPSSAPRKLRLHGTACGLSNPLVFCVGRLPEFVEKPARKRRGTTRNLRQPGTPAPSPRTTEMRDHAAGHGERPDPAGRRATGYRFTARKGSGWSRPPRRAS